MRTQAIKYLVKERESQGILFSSSNQKECIEFILKELRNRNKKDGYDEYWHNTKLVIIKQTITSEPVYVC